VRAAVGDRYVLEAMRAGGFMLGGEQSGHIIDLERNTTGDGPMAAVAILSILARRGSTLRALTEGMRDYPQVLLNVRTDEKKLVDSEPLRAAVARAESELAGDGRVLVRPSGTEPLIRVMIEGSDRAQIERLANELAEIVRGGRLG